MPKRSQPPLTPEIVADDVALGAAVDRILLRHPKLRAQQAVVLKVQTRLKALLDDESSLAFLAVDEASTARLADALVTIARWAFCKGVRFGGGKRP